MTSVLFLLLCLSSVVTVAARATAGERRAREAASSLADDDNKKLLEQMMTAVELGMSFFSEDYSSVNVDGLFGMRLGQGQILAAIKECKNSSSCPEDVQRRLQAVNDDIEKTATEALKYVQEEDPEYFKLFADIVEKPYMQQYLPRKLKDLEKTPIGYDSHYNEELGDNCLSRIMGTFEDNGVPVEECNVTKTCWDTMTAEGGSEYTITHQLLYFSIIDKQGCVDKVESSTGAKIGDTQVRMCGSIYNEAVSEINAGDVPEKFQDLFMEQLLLCGVIGFEDFLRYDWMRLVLTWQNPTGCFTMKNTILLEMGKKLLESQQKSRQLMHDLKEEANMIEEQHHGRKLLREQIMKDGCLAHKTGLGFGTMSLFTRYLVHQNFLTSFSH